MAKNKKSFILYADQKPVFDKLTRLEKGELIEVIFSYINDEEPNESELSDRVDMAFTVIKLQLNRDLEKWKGIKEKRSLAGKASAEAKRNKIQQDATKSTHVESVEQDSTKSTVTVNVNDTVTVNGTVNDNETDNETVNETYKSDIGVKTPNDESFIELEEVEKEKRKKLAAKKEKEDLTNQAIDQIIEALRNKTGRSFGIDTQSYRDIIRARLNDRLKVHDLIDMITFKCTEWFGTDMEKFLRPETLFQKSKCQGYVDTMKQYKTDSSNGAFKDIKGKAIKQNKAEILAAIEKQLER